MYLLTCLCGCLVFFFFKQKTAYEMRISDWSSDVCSSDLSRWIPPGPQARAGRNTDRDEKMAGAKNHDYHILPPSFWPLLGAFSALAMAAGGIMWMHGGHLSPDKANGGGWIFFLGLAGVLVTMPLRSGGQRVGKVVSE